MNPDAELSPEPAVHATCGHTDILEVRRWQLVSGKCTSCKRTANKLSY
jgi:hypothetical protein